MLHLFPGIFPVDSRMIALVRCPCAFWLRRFPPSVCREFCLILVCSILPKNSRIIVTCPCVFRLRRLAGFHKVCVPILDHLLVPFGLWTVDFTCRGRPNFQFSSHSPWFTSLLDSVGLFVEMYPKAKHLDCFSTWVLQTWQARLIQRGSKPHWRCIHVEAGIACNRRDWMECYTTNIFYVALACKLTHQILKTTCIYNIHIIYIYIVHRSKSYESLKLGFSHWKNLHLIQIPYSQTSCLKAGFVKFGIAASWTTV